MLKASLILAGAVPAYGLIGIATTAIGLRKGWELIAAAGFYGLAMGPMQGFSRTLFGSLIPRGNESAFFSLYEVTNKGSSFLGPLVLGAVAQGTGSMRLGLIYSIIMIALPLMALSSVDWARGSRLAAQADHCHHPQGWDMEEMDTVRAASP